VSEMDCLSDAEGFGVVESREESGQKSRRRQNPREAQKSRVQLIKKGHLKSWSWKARRETRDL